MWRHNFQSKDSVTSCHTSVKEHLNQYMIRFSWWLFILQVLSLASHKRNVFKNNFWEQQSFFVWPLVPLSLNAWWHLPWVLKPRWIPHLCASSPGCNWFKSRITSPDLLTASMTAGSIWSMFLYKHWRDSNLESRVRYSRYSIRLSHGNSALQSKYHEIVMQLEANKTYSLKACSRFKTNW